MIPVPIALPRQSSLPITSWVDIIRDMNALPFQTADELDEFLTRPTPRLIESLQNVSGRFAILGAGGKLGFHAARMLQRALAESNHGSERIVAVSRFQSPQARRPFESAGIELLSADLTDPDQVAALPEAENVIYLAGMKFGTAGNPQLLEEMNVRMPQRVAQRFRNSRIVALSTGNVYSYTAPASGGPDEQGETEPPGTYGRSCLQKEQAFLDASRQYGTRCVIIRLNYAIAMRYGVLNDIAMKVQNGQPVNIDTGYVNVIWQGDAVSHILQSITIADSPAVILNVTGPEVLSVRELAEQFGKRFNRPVQFEGTEAATALLSNAGRSHKLFGPPRVSVDEMIDWTAAWLAQGGETLDKPTHFEVRTGIY